MRVLVATSELQGTRAGDYAWTVDGELVVAEATSCGHPACGCGRGFPGLASSRATTTAMVADLPHIEPDALREVIGDWLERGGWVDLLDDPDDIVEIIDEHFETISLICSAYPVGTIVERNGVTIRPRKLEAAA
jgi:hypothetical protein